METFEEIYKEYSKKVYHFLLALTGSVQQADDILQETFYQAFLHINQFKGRSSLYTWLCQIAKNQWYKECKRNNRFVPLEKYLPENHSPPPEDIVIEKEDIKRLRNAISELTSPYKDVVCLHIYGGIPLKEISALYNKSSNWGCVTYHRAKVMIHEKLSAW